MGCLQPAVWVCLCVRLDVLVDASGCACASDVPARAPNVCACTPAHDDVD